MQPSDDADTALARLLHQRGEVSLPDLQAGLAEARRRRAAGGTATLPSVLLERRLVGEERLRLALGGLPATRSDGGARGSAESAVSRPASGGAAGRSAVASSSSGLLPSARAGLPPRIGPYRLLREIARGGMGAVHEVVHEETGARYALKTLLPGGLGGEDPELLERFRREAQLGARLDHPNIVRVHAADPDALPPWLVQDLVTGGSLGERLREGPLPLSEALDVVRRVGAALAHAHARSVLHRDLKPDNVLFDETGEPKLVDFGVARSLSRESIRLTATGTVMGSPNYMAPEQALGDDVDVRADVYALAALLYACLTGRPPFPGTHALAVMEQVVTAPPPSPRKLRPDVPPGLDALVLRGLAKAPADRPPSVADFLAELESVCSASRTPARGALLAVGAGAAALLAVVVGWTATTSARERELANPSPPARALPPASPPPAEDASTTSRPPLRWALSPGDIRRLRLRRVETEDESFDYDWRVDLVLEVDEVVEGQVQARLLVERIALDATSNAGQVAYDSVRPQDCAFPFLPPFFAPLRGSELALTLDAATGAVLDLSGLPELVLPAVLENPELVAVKRDVDHLRMSFGDACFRRILDNVLRVFPPDGGAERWTVAEPVQVEEEFTLAGSRVLTRVGDAVESLDFKGDGFGPDSDHRNSTLAVHDVRVRQRVALHGPHLVRSMLTVDFESAFTARNGRRQRCQRRVVLTLSDRDRDPELSRDPGAAAGPR